MAGDVAVKDFNIKPIAEKVAKCCAGLPLLIVTVAKGLRKKHVVAWRDALIQLERLDHEDLREKVFPTLELSFNFLGDDQKSLLLFISSFGLSYIHIGELFSCCWRLGFYERMNTLAKERNIDYKLINDLRASSLLLEAEAEPEWVRMHDVVSYVAKSIASRQRYTEIKEWPMVDQLQKFHYIIIPGSYYDELPEKLELLVLGNYGDHHVKFPHNFFSGMRPLRTLLIGGMAFTPSLPPSLDFLTSLLLFQELPKEIGHLTHLRLLNLANCSELRVIPTTTLGAQTFLEDLSFANLKDVKDAYQLNDDSVEKFQVIKVGDCDKMKILLLYSLLNFSKLRQMKITGCKDMKEIIALEKQEDEKKVPGIDLRELKGLPMLLIFCLQCVSAIAIYLIVLCIP
ncbi:putative disease resistance protein [Glycine max]|nr:putative disease resistance protein [Glycine max]